MNKKHFTIRLPERVLTFIDVAAEKENLSRTFAIERLIMMGIKAFPGRFLRDVEIK